MLFPGLRNMTNFSGMLRGISGLFRFFPFLPPLFCRILFPRVSRPFISGGGDPKKKAFIQTAVFMPGGLWLRGKD